MVGELLTKPVVLRTEPLHLSLQLLFVRLQRVDIVSKHQHELGGGGGGKRDEVVMQLIIPRHETSQSPLQYTGRMLNNI